jgi:ABC-type dipeptide/oligopeptide/nickel transport system permease component
MLHALMTLAFVMEFNFFLFRVMPGDPAELLLRTRPRSAQRTSGS